MSTDGTTLSDDTDTPTREDIADVLDVTAREFRAFRERHPDPDPHTVLGRFGAPPGGAQERLVAAWVGDDVDTAGRATGASGPSGACERDGALSDDAEPDDTADAPDPDGAPDAERGDVDAHDPHGEGWAGVEWDAPATDVYPPALLEREQWMGRAGKSEKLPFAPWADANPPDAGPEDSPRWEWGREENYADGATVAIEENGRPTLEVDLC